MARQPHAALAVLSSGGLDSAVLLADSLRQGSAVHPLYVRSGLAWERDELLYLNRFLDAVRTPALRPLQILDLPVADLYGDHWSLTGRNVPDATSPDVAVFLPGRNVLLLAKALLWCHLHRVPALALGLLGSNPFPDATGSFFSAYSDAVNQAVGGSVQVVLPYLTMRKAEVLQRAKDVPLKLTFSCIQPVEGRHCGRCNKCAERQQAFKEAKLLDATEYIGRLS